MARTDLTHTSAQVIAAIKGSGGIKQAVADRLGVHRHTLDRYLERFEAAAQALVEETEREVDHSELVIISVKHETQAALNAQGQPVVNPDGKPILIPSDRALDTARWHLSKKGRARGYGDRTDIDLTSGGQPVKGYVGITPDDWDKQIKKQKKKDDK